MSKIICDVCGTQYPESAEACPICGRVRVTGGKTAADDILMDEAQAGTSRSKVRGGRFSKANVRKRNRNVPRYENPQENPRGKKRPEPEEEYTEPERQNGSNRLLNILLVVVIVALLVVTGYIFVEFFLPNVLLPEETIPTETVPATTAAPTETEEPTVPCVGLELTDGEEYVELTEEGQSWLLNIAVSPEDTTDVLNYISSNEDVVAVNSEGRITAVSEGEAVVTAYCGDVSLDVYVSCVFTPAETETVPPTEEPTEPLKDVTLKVNLTDISFNAKGQGYTFKVDGLTNQEVKWTSEDESIVTIDEDGKAISVGAGRTNIICQYGDQTVTIIVRCAF